MTTVTIEHGTLVGSNSKTPGGYEYIEFLQIPYAKPPVGELRFKPPQPLDSWTGSRDATQQNDANISFQLDMFKKTITGSEDCLYLNVYTPGSSQNRQTLLPVMVHIHGGGFIGGSGTQKSFSNPNFLIEQDVVVVSINYRVGIFGFLSLEIPEAAGNMGLKDQAMALKWVQANIDKFGGDKNNITIFGASAGGASIDYLLLSPLTKNLFHKAIVQSGATLNHWASNYNIKQCTLKLARDLGFVGPESNITEAYNFLMQQPTEAFAESTVRISNLSTGKATNFTFVPCIEKDFKTGEEFITDYPYNMIKEGKFNKVPVMRGFDEFEGSLVKMFRPGNIRELAEQNNYTEFLTHIYNEKEILKYNSKFVKAYSKDTQDIAVREQLALEFFSNFDFGAGVWIGSKIMANHGVIVYNYLFCYDGAQNFSRTFLKLINKSDSEWKGAGHADHMSYILDMGLINEKPLATDARVINRMIQMWTNFAKTGNPIPSTSDLLPVQWPRFTVDRQQYLRIDAKLTVEAKYQTERMAIFEELYEKYRK